MRVTLVGLQDMDFELGKDTIDGVKFHYNAKDRTVLGYMASQVFITREFLNDVGVKYEDMTDFIGKEINIEFNQKGKVTDISI